MFCKKITPWTVLSPAEKGGRLGVGLATLPHKNHVATETPMISQQSLQVLEEEGLSSGRCMTSCRESRKEAATLTTLLMTRKTLNIGTWNIRTMFESGKTVQVAREMPNYNLVLLGLCENRWKQSGQLQLTTGEMVLYSGHEENSAPHSEGVALLLTVEAQKALIGWEARGPRFITASFRTVRKNIRMNVVQSQHENVDLWKIKVA